jgi:hypothetical protein
VKRDGIDLAAEVRSAVDGFTEVSLHVDSSSEIKHGQLVASFSPIHGII